VQVKQANGIAAFPRSLGELPLAWRTLLTCVVVFIGAGYFAALVNIVGQTELTDGKPGMSTQDLILKYAGADVELVAGQPPPSRMLEMIGTAMRQYFSDDENYNTLHDWLSGGAAEAAFSAGEDTAPQDVFIMDCLRCHAADGGEEIGTKSPFGPDLFTPDFKMISEFTLAPAPGKSTVHRAPRSWRDLALTTHAHLLSVPMFVVLLGGLFLFANRPQRFPRLRILLACAPLVLFLLDVACWWLARIPNVGWVFALTIAATGALFGLTFGIQWLTVMIALWRKPVEQRP